MGQVVIMPIPRLLGCKRSKVNFNFQYDQYVHLHRAKHDVNGHIELALIL